MSASRNSSHESDSGSTDDVALLAPERERAVSLQFGRALIGDPQLLAAFVECVPAAIAMLDRSLRYVHVSNRWLRDFGLTREAVIGRTHHEVFPNIPERWRATNLRGLAGTREKCEADRLVCADGTERWVRWEVQPWDAPGSDAGGILIFSEDITERKRTETALHEREEMLRLAQAAAHIGTWEWNTASGEDVWSPELYQLYGLVGVSGSSRHTMWRTRVHEQDLPIAQAHFDAARAGEGIECEYRFLHPTRGWRWLYAKGRRSEDDRERMLGIVIDITERKQREEELRSAHDDLAHRVRHSSAELERINEDLRHSEEGFALLVESVRDYAIYLLDVDGNVSTWNRGAQRIKGYRRDEIVGRHYSIFYPPEARQSNRPMRHLEYAANEGRFSEEGWRVRKDGSRFWANVVITPLYRDGVLRGFAKVTRDATERKRSEEAIRELSGQLLRSQDETQRRLARELHDSTGQTLSALALNLVVVKQAAAVSADPQAAAAIGECMQLIEQASREIRTLSYLLHPPLLDEAGLYHALRWYIEGFVQRTNIMVDFDAPMDAPRPAREIEMALFRIVQESLTNIRRHAESDRIDIHFSQEPDYIVLKIRDYGKGMPPEAFELLSGMPTTLGVGLRGMFERVRQLDGYIDLSRESPGTLLRAVLPLVESDDR